MTRVLWPSATACPVRAVTGTACHVVDPVSGHTFNLAPLATVPDQPCVLLSVYPCYFIHFIPPVTFIDHLYLWWAPPHSSVLGQTGLRVSVCRPLTSPCAAGAGACAGSVAAGNATQRLQLLGSELSLTYSAATGVTKIVFVCSTDSAHQNKPFVLTNHTGAMRTVYWPTSRACTAEQEV